MPKIAILILVCCLVGCTHRQLRFNTVHTAQTVHDVYTQQVLDNLAKFASNPNALPHFSIASAASSDVSDTGMASASLNFNPFRLTSWLTGVNASRNMREGYTLAPINDPRKLELMRCAYQRATSPCTCRGESDFCPNCEKRFNRFYLGTETPGKTPKQTYDGNPVYGYEDCSVREVFVELNELGTLVAKDAATGQPEFWDPATILTYKQSNTAPKLFPLYVDNSVADFTARSGRVTAACLHGQCWFQCGKWSDYKKHRSRCTLAGHYCDTYVWVPDTGTDQLTKLTLTI